MSVPLGGTISTIVANSPVASFLPSRERFSNGTVGSATGSSPFLTFAPAVLARAPPTRRADFISLICSGVVPQQPPTRFTPAATNFLAYLAMYPGEQR